MPSHVLRQTQNRKEKSMSKTTDDQAERSEIVIGSHQFGLPPRRSRGNRSRLSGLLRHNANPAHLQRARDSRRKKDELRRNTDARFQKPDLPSNVPKTRCGALQKTYEDDRRIESPDRGSNSEPQIGHQKLIYTPFRSFSTHQSFWRESSSLHQFYKNFDKPNIKPPVPEFKSESFMKSEKLSRSCSTSKQTTSYALEN
jgi:hypothetical protein